MTRVLFIIALVLFFAMSTAWSCTAEDDAIAAHWEYYTPEEAYEFGARIQELVKAKDLQGLYALVKDEPVRGPKKSEIVDKSFDDFFDETWTAELLSELPPCRPVGWRGFMLGSGLIWFKRGSQPDSPWYIFSINGTEKASS